MTRDGQEVELRGKGRHDPCVLPRAVPMVEAMMALTLLDQLLQQQAQCELLPDLAKERPNPMGVTARREGGPHVIGMESHATQSVSQRVDEE